MLFSVIPVTVVLGSALREGVCSLLCSGVLTDHVSSPQGLYSSVVCPGLVMSNMTYRILPVFLWTVLMPIMWLVSEALGWCGGMCCS